MNSHKLNRNMLYVHIIIVALIFIHFNKLKDASFTRTLASDLHALPA